MLALTYCALLGYSALIELLLSAEQNTNPLDSSHYNSVFLCIIFFVEQNAINLSVH